MLVSIIGKIGSGKTLLATRLALADKRKVYANYKIDILNYEKLTLAKLFELNEPALVIIDEGYVWLESRISQSKLNRYVSYVIFQSRKRNIDIVLTCQLWSSIDLRYRYQSDILIYAERKTYGFKYRIVSQETGNEFIIKWLEEDAEKVFKYYDTMEMIIPERVKFDTAVISRNPKKLKQYLKKFGKILIPEFQDNSKKLTHDFLKYRMLEKGIPLELEKYLYIYIKGVLEEKNEDN